MSRRFTPFEMRILLWYYACAENPPEFAKSSAWDEVVYSLHQLELIKPTCRENCAWEATERGKALVEAILHHPLPVQRWVFE